MWGPTGTLDVGAICLQAGVSHYIADENLKQKNTLILCTKCDGNQGSKKMHFTTLLCQTSKKVANLQTLNSYVVIGNFMYFNVSLLYVKFKK